jgi:hypothetical protein
LFVERQVALWPEIADAVLQGHELAPFGAGGRKIEDGEVFKVADVDGAEPELRRIGLPAEREIPVFDFALKLVIDPDATPSAWTLFGLVF